MKIIRWKEKLIVSLGYVAFVAICWVLKIPCLWQHFLGIPCPGCGMTRAWDAFLHLDLANAFRHHAMFWSMPLIALYLLKDGGLFKSRRANAWFLGFIGAGFLVNWVFRLV